MTTTLPSPIGLPAILAVAGSMGTRPRPVRSTVHGRAEIAFDASDRLDDPDAVFQ